jgi:hypothetical protein
VERKSVRPPVRAHELPRETRGQLSRRHPAKRGVGLVLNPAQGGTERGGKAKGQGPFAGINRIPRIRSILLSRQNKIRDRIYEAEHLA